MSLHPTKGCLVADWTLLHLNSFQAFTLIIADYVVAYLALAVPSS
jgi:hypothetical protein